MTISRGQMERQLRMGGGIMDVVPREPAILGGIKKAVKKVTKGVKKIAKSPIGKAALLYAGTAGLGALGAGAARATTGFGGIFNPGNVLANLSTTGSNIAGLFASRQGPTSLFRSAQEVGLPKTRFGKFLAGAKDAITGSGNIGKLATLGAVSTFLTKSLGMPEEQAEAEVARDPSKYLELYYRNLNPPGNKDPETYEAEVAAFVTANTSEYAVGGRVGFADGPVLPPDPTQPVNPFGPKPGDFGIEENIPIKMASNIENDKILEALYEKYIDLGFSPKEAADKAMEEFDRMSMMKTEGRGLAAIGGRMMKAVGDSASMNAMQAAGIEGLPIRQNKAGVKELDLRETGGFIPPVGIKEKEDDIPAMLSNNEFVMTADAVRGMGDGNVELGAQRMYDQMKMLEAGGKV
tara:strand:+ start:22 stop:1242 length:1221 start_codon:yes stop_codon:yes gene_type:complete